MAQTCLIRLVLLLLLALPVAAQFETSAVIQYTAESIYLGFYPTAMNNRGWIVGYRDSRPDPPMRYRPGVGIEQLSEHWGRLWDINDAGTAVGEISVGGACQEAMIRPAGAPWKRIGKLGGTCSTAYAINEAGQVAGYAYIPEVDGGNRPFIYTEAEGMKMLFDRTAIALGINETGQVTGRLSSNSHPPGFLWDPVQGLVAIRGDSILDGFRIAGIADNGTVAMSYLRRAQPGNLATFSLAGGLRLLGHTYNLIIPRAVNDRGWIVGQRENVAFLYVYGQGSRNLNSLLTTPLANPLVDAIDINDRDEILAYTVNATGRHYYILRRVR